MSPPPDGTELLERAIGYALGAVGELPPGALARPTPCAGWDLRTLLRHLNESLAALREGVDTGRVGLAPGAEDAATAADPADAFRGAASRLLAAWSAADRARRAVAVGGCPLTTSVVTSAGALEIAVHGWDVHRAAGRPDRPVPDGLADELLRVAPRLVPVPDARAPLFAAPVAVPPSARPGDRLVAFLGRDPARAPAVRPAP
ncbi:TIGR03086 family metal-binding protein [Streptomyces sp. TRM 70351]|uniref:TIGR03086 family metal-binding protein n=1 Tax=Streptomyces sp. TRM 70351 TaxID=3116552 RepID=UPI002E7ACB3C|nr:TIGR03086 family metal-binding protein [Streptomyces sp. TRM 70351]MEE1929354.1 TIGR03086 family metal-binding protein [Streptomyces sp. TRM 70351]